MCPTGVENMTKIALLIKHKTLPGKRDAVRLVWERYMQSAIGANAAHEAYYYCFDNNDPDTICAFQVYTNAAAAEAFLQTESYAAYLHAVEPLLVGAPEVTSLLPMWVKDA